MKDLPMSDNLQLTTHELWIDGRQMTASVTKPTPTTVRISWKLPSPIVAYAGAVVLLSEEKFSSVNFPEDGHRYTASTNWSAPADRVDHAHVVAAFYSYFGDSITQTSVDVTGVDPNKVYYASVHAASSVLQYYTIGTQSYPLESARFEKSSETYAGAIPSSPVPPANPTDGQVYYDPASNTVLVWTDSLSSWVASSQRTVPTGSLVPTDVGQLFYNVSDQTLKFFSGSAWVPCSSSNTRVRLSAGSWTTFNSMGSGGTLPSTPALGDFFHITYRAAVSAPTTYEIKFFTLGGWLNPSSDVVQVFYGGNWNSIADLAVTADVTDPAIPQIGELFYETNTRNLMIWSGSSWNKADTSSEGTPTTDKMGVGTDGSYDERLRLVKILKHQLGYPQICPELSEEQFNVAIDNALDEFRRRADNAYAHKFISFTIKKGQVVYYLNDPRDLTHRVVNVIKIHRINHLGISSLSAETGLYAQAFFNQLYQGSNVDVLAIHLMNQLSENYEKIFAGNLSFTWDEPSRQLTILRRVLQDQERVLLEVALERTEQELLYDRWAKQWIQGWAQSECWEMLGEIRSKYGSLPGPGGGLTLNGDACLSRSTELQTELLRQISDYEVGNGVNFGNVSFLLG